MCPAGGREEVWSELFDNQQMGALSRHPVEHHKKRPVRLQPIKGVLSAQIWRTELEVQGVCEIRWQTICILGCEIWRVRLQAKSCSRD